MYLHSILESLNIQIECVKKICISQFYFYIPQYYALVRLIFHLFYCHLDTLINNYDQDILLLIISLQKQGWQLWSILQESQNYTHVLYCGKEATLWYCWSKTNQHSVKVIVFWQTIWCDVFQNVSPDVPQTCGILCYQIYLAWLLQLLDSSSLYSCIPISSYFAHPSAGVQAGVIVFSWTMQPLNLLWKWVCSVCMCVHCISSLLYAWEWLSEWVTEWMSRWLSDWLTEWVGGWSGYVFLFSEWS